MKLDYAWTVVFFILQLKFSHAELLLTQILVHHAESTPSRLSVQAKFPFLSKINKSYIPEGSNRLTKLGRNKARELGASLREAYKNLIDAKEIYFRPEKTHVSIQSAMQLAQGLVPDYVPTDQEIANMTFKSNSWFNVVRLEVDPLFVGWLKCQPILSKVAVHNSELVADWNNFTERFQLYFEECTGSNLVGNFRSGFLFRQIRAMAQVGIPIDDCIKDVYPDGILKLHVLYEYDIQSATDDFIRYNGGTQLAFFLRNVDNYLNDVEMSRLSILVGNDINIVGLLRALDLHSDPHVPYYGSYIALELHHIDEEFVVRVMYQNGTFPKEPPEQLWLPYCTDECLLDEFNTVYQDRILRENMAELSCRAYRNSTGQN
ncbi:venom acid phosphatase Acph-1-like [Diachasmimorpha longicaudata]|uniref:venom acid phosphatase Acph-1-like n=1 Tax=Diachasmimorpha longicaudata TaxID=58733 RepID=UPI0030B90705